MSKTIENLKSGNYEVVDNQGVSVTRHFIECLEKEFADLEAKLAESEHRNEQLVDALNGEVFINYKLPMENAQLKQQLAEKDSELDKWSTVYARAYVNRQNALIAEKVELKEQLAEKEKEIENIRSTHIYRFYLDKDKVQDVYITDLMLKVFNQDKISFCIEKLEKVKENIKKVPITDFDLSGNFEKMYKQDAIRQIDNQIKQLKGKVEDVKD